MLLVLLADTVRVLAQRRIYNGREALESEFPSVVNVRAAGTTCGGALIDQNFVLTAGHCLMNVIEDQEIFVSLGSLDYYTYVKQPRRVFFKEKMAFWIHENFSMPAASDDIALIRLPKPIKFSQNIKPVKLSSDMEIDKRGERVVVLIAGWGEMETGEPADTLRTAKLQLIPVDECVKYQSNYYETITRDHLCAFQLEKSANATGPCDGDSGRTNDVARADQSEYL